MPPTPAISDAAAPSLALPVLYYHLISEPPTGHRRPAIYMEPRRFDRQLALLRRLGYRSIGLGEFADCLESGRQPPGKRVLITFDDGHRDNFTVARPILLRHGFRAAVFVVAGAIGGRLRLRSGGDPDGEPIMSAEELRRMADEGFEIGSHGMTHANLARLAPDAARDEIERSKTVLESIVQRPVMAFSYPYGSFKPAHVAMVQQAGYRLAFSTVRGRRHRPDERFCLKRIPIHHRRGLLGFYYLLRWRPFGRAQAQLDRRREGQR